MSKDAAMLVWLDSNSNVKGKPNENYAREVMELFTLGVGNYTEKDIREAARAFTGWHTDGADFEFNAALPRRRRRRPSSARPATGTATTCVRILLEQPDCAAFLVAQALPLLRQRDARAARRRLLEPLADSFRKSDYDIAALVKTILSSRHFFSDHAFRQRIKSPVEYVLGAVRRLPAVRRGEATTAVAAAVAGAAAGSDGPASVRPAQRQGLAGRQGVAEHLHRAGTR